MDFYDEGYDDDDEQSLNNRIVFPQDKLFGRDKELTILHDLYSSMCVSNGTSSKSAKVSPSKQPEENRNNYSNLKAARSSSTFLTQDDDSFSLIVIISGFSGAGKSYLVNQFIEALDSGVKDGKAKPFLYLSGKYEELQNADPFSAIVQAFSGMCRFLLQESEKKTLERVQAAIEESLGTEAVALVAVVPDLKDIIGGTSSMEPGGAEQGAKAFEASATDNAWNKLRYLFQIFFKALCDEAHPLIIFLDDLQWADTASIALIEALIKDKSLRHFMFIGALRVDELKKMDCPIIELLERTESSGQKVERIELEYLAFQDIQSFIAETLSLETSQCLSLALVVYEKTGGNVFFVMQALEELQRANALYYSVISFRWEWDIDELNAVLSDNLGDAVAAKLKSAPATLQKALAIASYIRSTIEIESLRKLMEVDGCKVDSEELVELLETAVLDGLLVHAVGSGAFKFAHDRIQQAANSLVPASSRNDLRIKLGKKLFEIATSRLGQDWMFFVAADHLNSTLVAREEDLLSLVTLNLCCGEKAGAVAAFVPASVYYRLALKMLRKHDNYWEAQYDLSLRLSRALCDVELCLGNFDSGNELGQDIIRKAKNLQDRLPTFLSLAIAKGRQQRHVEALELCQVALLELGAIPKRFHTFHILKDTQIVKRLFKRYSDLDILSLPKMTDEKKLAAAKFLSEASLRAYYCGNLLEYMFYMLRNLRITFKYGLTGACATSFAGYGLFLDGSCGDHTGALRMARLAREILDRTNDSKPFKALTLLTASLYIEAWSQPIDKILETGQKAHRAGMECGNIELGFLNWATCSLFAYTAGYPLDPIERTGRELLEQLQLYNVDSVLSMFSEIMVPVRYLVGRADGPLDWNEVASFDARPGDASDTYHAIFGYMGRLELAVYYGKWEVAVKMFEGLPPHATRGGSYSLIAKSLFFSGLAFSALARETGARRYYSHAFRSAQKMSQISRTRGLNVLHKSLLMNADLLACRSRNVEKLSEAYDDAIIAALKIGYTHDAALASELAGELFLSLSDELRGLQYLRQARDLYHEWGAMAKVAHICKRRRIENTFEVTAFGNDLQCYRPMMERGDSRRSIDLDLISGAGPRTELPISPKDTTVQTITSRDRDEISILTDPS